MEMFCWGLGILEPKASDLLPHLIPYFFSDKLKVIKQLCKRYTAATLLILRPILLRRHCRSSRLKMGPHPAALTTPPPPPPGARPVKCKETKTGRNLKERTCLIIVTNTFIIFYRPFTVGKCLEFTKRHGFLLNIK